MRFNKLAFAAAFIAGTIASDTVYAGHCTGILSDPHVQGIGNKMLDIELNDEETATRTESLQQIMVRFMNNTEESAKISVPIARAYDWKQITSGQIIACFPRTKILASLVAKREAAQSRVNADRSARLREQEQRASRDQAERDVVQMQPLNLLARAYGNYIFVKRCYEARQGYLSVFINDREMDRAKNEVQAISSKIKSNEQIDDDQAWKLGNSFADTGSADRDSCQATLALLDRVAKLADPGGSQTKKDF